MTHYDRTQRREQAAEFWDSHGIDEAVDDDAEVHVQVRKPLSAMLSLRLAQDDLDKLRLIARNQGVGQTTMARMLLHQSLEDPQEPSILPAVRPDEVAEVMNEAKTPLGDGDVEFLVLSRHDLNRIDQMVTNHAFRLWVEGLRRKAVSITPRHEELFDRIKELQPSV